MKHLELLEPFLASLSAASLNLSFKRPLILVHSTFRSFVRIISIIVVVNPLFLTFSHFLVLDVLRPFLIASIAALLSVLISRLCPFGVINSATNIATISTLVDENHFSVAHANFLRT